MFSGHLRAGKYKRKEALLQASIRELLVSCFIQQPEEPSVPVVVDIPTAGDAVLHFQGVIGKALCYGPQNISVDFRVGTDGRLLHQLHAVTEEQPRLRTLGSRVAVDLTAADKDCQVGRAFAQAVQCRMSLFPNRVLEAEMLELVIPVAFNPVFVFA